MSQRTARYLGGSAILRDGTTVNVREMVPGDEPRMVAFFDTLSEESRWMRFCSMLSKTSLHSEVHREACLDPGEGFGLVATTGAEDRVIAHAFFIKMDPHRAEVAFAIADDYQGRGLGTLLLGQLAQVGRAEGTEVFEADLMGSNYRMLEVFRQSGFRVHVTARAGQLHVAFPISVTGEAVDRFYQREQTATINSMHPILTPKSVAVIGASRSRGTIGGELFHNLLTSGFNGPVYPVNSNADVVQSVPAFQSILAVPGPIDLAVIAVPAAHAVDVARDCASAGVRALLVISAGFAETGDEGKKRQDDLVRVCRQSGMRLVGPNCMGVINTARSVGLNATFAPGTAPPGRVAFSSQSGALGLSAIDHARSMGLGISSFISVGNKADVSGNDLLYYWGSDPDTDVILLYLESFGNPRKFSQIARSVARLKPVLAVKSGRSSSGARATRSHTGALLAASDVAVDALFKQAGVIRTDTLAELFDAASLLVNQPVPEGRRVGIITNSGGPAILCADACEARGLEIPLLGETTQEALRAILSAEASVGNPVDMIASATADCYRRAITAVGADQNVDALVVIFTPPLAGRIDEIGKAIAEAAKGLGGTKPVISVLMSSLRPPAGLRGADVSIPVFCFPEEAAIALSHAVRYGQWRRRPRTWPERIETRAADRAASLIAEALGRGQTWLGPEDISTLFNCYGLPLVQQEIVGASAGEAAQAAARFGGPVALKAIGSDIVHKTEAGAVRLGLNGPDEVRLAATRMLSALRDAGHSLTGLLIQKMADEGAEMLVGVVSDPSVGPVVACGAGGVRAELFKDVAAGVAPLSFEDTTEMIRSLKSYPLLSGFRGSPKLDVGALERVVLAVSSMADAIPAIAELECNPVIVHERGVEVVDARVRIAHTSGPDRVEALAPRLYSSL